MDRILALYDSDVFYATRFMEYLNKRKENDFEISVFTRKESLEEFLRLHKVEILLSGEQLNLEEQSLNNIRYTYQLSEGSPEKEDNNEFWINKYQSVRIILDRIMADYQEKEHITNVNSTKGQMNIISVFSPVPGMEKLLFSWALSLQMSNDSNVLLVLLDPLAVPLLSDNDNKNQSLSEFIYYLRENSNLDKMKPLLMQNGRLSYLSGILHGSDLLSLSREDILKWVEELRKNSQYNEVVFYLGCYTEAVLELIDLSDTVLVTSINNTYEKAVLTEWERQMAQVEIPINQKKFQVLCLHEQEELGHVPLTMQELIETISWEDAEKYLYS